MFRECLQCVEEIVGSHSTTQGCRIDRLLVALTEVVLPLHGVRPCATMIGGVLQLASLEGSGMTCQTLVAPTPQQQRGAHAKTAGGGETDDWIASGIVAPEGWIEQVLDDVGLRRRLTMVPVRELQHRVAGFASGAFVSEATDVALDLLGEHLLYGLPLSELRAGVLHSRALPEFHAVMATLWDHGVITSAALVTPGTIREHIVFRHADAALDVVDGGSCSVTRRWLAFVRSGASAGDAVAQTGFEEELLNFSTGVSHGGAVAAAGAAAEADMEDQPLSSVYASNRRHASVVGAPTFSGRLVVGKFVEDRVLTVEFRKLMTDAYQHLTTLSAKTDDEGVEGSGERTQPMPPVNLISALSARIAEHYGTRLTRATKDGSTTVLHRRIAELRLADPVRVARSATDYAYLPTDDYRRVRDCEVMTLGEQDRSAMPTEWFVPIGRQVVRYASHTTVALHCVKPPYVTIRDLSSRVRSLAATTEFRNCVEVTASRCADSKSFTITARPCTSSAATGNDDENFAAGGMAGGGGSSGVRKARDGVSQWAREQLLAKLLQSTSAGATLEELQADLDTRTLRRLIHQLKADGLVHTTSYQPQGKRLQGIVCLASRSAPTDEEKRQIVEAAAARLTSAATSTKLRTAAAHRHKLGEERVAAVKVKVEHSNEVGADAKPNTRVFGRSPPKPLLGNRVRAAVCLARNGYCANFTARCWRLHLQLIDLCFGPLRHRRMHIPSGARQEQDREGALHMTVGDILEHMSLSTFCVVLGFSADDVARYFPVGDVRGIPWGSSIRHLPLALLRQCHEYPKQGLFAVLQGLAARGVLECALDADVLEQRRPYHAPTDAACRILLNRLVTAADGTTWRLYDEHDATSTMTHVSAFWSLHEVTEPITPVPSVKPARKAALERLVKATGGKPSATELYVVARLLRVRLIALATYCLQARADTSHVAQISDVHRHLFGVDKGSATGHAAESTLLRRFAGHVGPVGGGSESSSDSADDEGPASSNRRLRRRHGGDAATLTSHASRRGRLFRKSSASVTQEDVYAALRVAVLGDDYVAVLLRICRIVRNLSPVYRTIIGVVIRLLEAFDAAPTSTASAAARRAQRLEVLDSVWRPTGGDGSLPPSRDVALTEAEAGPAGDTRETAANHSGAVIRPSHMEVMRCILLSRAAHSSRAHRDALLAEHGLLEPEGAITRDHDGILSQVCLELRRRYPSQFCRGTQLNDQYTYDRLHRLLLPSRVVHVPHSFACDSLATSVVARAAHALAQSSLSVVNAADAPREMELIRQPIVDLQAFAEEPMEERFFDAVFLPTLKVPDEWRGLAENIHRPVADWLQQQQQQQHEQPSAKAAAASDETLHSLPFRLRDPPRALWREQTASTSRNKVLLELPPEVDDALPAVPPRLRGTSCAHMDGTWNAFVAATEVARIRAVLLASPGTTRRQLVHRLCADGHTGARVVLWLLERMVNDGIVLTRWNTAQCTHPGLPVFRLRPQAVTFASRKRERSYDDEHLENELEGDGHEAAYWWNVAWAAATVCAHPLGMVVCLERPSAALSSAATGDDERQWLHPAS